MGTYSCKTKKLRNVYTIRGARNISINNIKGKLTTSKLKSSRLSYNLVSTMPFVMKKIVSEYDQEIPQSQTANNPLGTARKNRSTITRHLEDKLSKATSSLLSKSKKRLWYLNDSPYSTDVQ